jgi:hypothetical protein
MGAGNRVLWVDFEDDADTVIERLEVLGARQDWIRERFVYISPSEKLDEVSRLEVLAFAQGEPRTTLAVLDGVTEGMALHGLKPNDADDVAKFGHLLARPLAAAGAATAALDHVTKDREQRGRYAIGSVHKLNAVSGAAFVLENVDPFGEGLAGKSRLLITKDRPGKLRAQSLRTGKQHMFGTFTLDTSTVTPEPAALQAPAETGPFRPTVYMRRVSTLLASEPEAVSGNRIETGVTGKREVIRLAINCLVSEGYVTRTRQGRAQVHALVKPFTE